MKNLNFSGTMVLLLTAIAGTAAGVTPTLACADDAADNQLTEEEKEQGWKLLFNGKDFSGWRTNTGEVIQSHVEDGAMQVHGNGGYLVIHEEPQSDFVLKCDVKMSEPRCNSGVFVRVGEPKDPVYTGLEVQVNTGDGTSMHDFGAIYDLIPPSKNASKGAGEWNQIEIRCEGPHVSVKVNGQQVAEMNADEFDEPGLRPDGSKHKFGKAIKEMPRKGFLGFQDHGQQVWYKNVKLLDLTDRSDS